MAKQAKQVDDVPDSAVVAAVRDILQRYAEIESERGTFMAAARREREGMTAVYEAMAARGVSQRAMKTEIKIIRAMERIRGWRAELEEEDAKMLAKLARAQGDKRQLFLFDITDEPKAPRKQRVAKAPKLRVVENDVAAE